MVRSLVADGAVTAAHDVSGGGLGVALAEMAIGGRLGAKLDLAAMPGSESVKGELALAFCESNSRLLVEVPAEKAEAFEAAMAGAPCARAGEVTGDGVLSIVGANGEAMIQVGLDETVAAFTGRG